MDKTEKALRMLLHSLMHTAQSRQFSDVSVQVTNNFIEKVEKILDTLDSEDTISTTLPHKAGGK